MDHDQKINEAFANVRSSFYELCDAEARLKKARRRALIVRTVEKAVVVGVAAAIYNHMNNKK